MSYLFRGCCCIRIGVLYVAFALCWALSVVGELDALRGIDRPDPQHITFFVLYYVVDVVPRALSCRPCVRTGHAAF